MVHLTVNGKTLAMPGGATVLQAAHTAGAELPTLCHHDGLAPYGACRLCMVAVVAPRRALVASCAYPVEEGMVIETDAPEAIHARRLALEFLLSRCPQAATIRALAAQAGVTATRLGAPAPARAEELCMLCGLCVRVCREAIGAAAISFTGRGMNRRVDTPFSIQSESCIGCGACAEICPTGAIKIEDRGSQRILHTWHTTVTLHTCPQCGRFFAPEPMVFLKKMYPEIKELWALCPDCRRRQTARQWVEQSVPGAVERC